MGSFLVWGLVLPDAAVPLSMCAWSNHQFFPWYFPLEQGWVVLVGVCVCLCLPEPP